MKRTITEEHIDGILTRAGVHELSEDGMMRSLPERVAIAVQQRDEFMDRLHKIGSPETYPEPKGWYNEMGAVVRWDPGL